MLVRDKDCAGAGNRLDETEDACEPEVETLHEKDWIREAVSDRDAEELGDDETDALDEPDSAKVVL